jgi:hypothetical protein
MLLATLALTAILTAPIELPNVTPPADPAFPTIAADQTRPAVALTKQRMMQKKPGTSLYCLDGYTCWPTGAPPDGQSCTYSGDPRNGCEQNGAVCDLCFPCPLGDPWC